MASKVLRPDETHPRRAQLYGAAVLQSRTRGHLVPQGSIRVRVRLTDGNRQWLPVMPLSEYESLNPRLESET